MRIKVILASLLVLSNVAWCVAYQLKVHSLKLETMFLQQAEQQRDFFQSQDVFLFPYYADCMKARAGSDPKVLPRR